MEMSACNELLIRSKRASLQEPSLHAIFSDNLRNVTLNFDVEMDVHEGHRTEYCMAWYLTPSVLQIPQMLRLTVRNIK